MKRLAASVILVLLVSVPAAAIPYPIPIPIQEDVFVRAKSPDTNYGTGQPGLGGLAVSGVSSTFGLSGAVAVGRVNSFMKFTLTFQFEDEPGHLVWFLDKLNEDFPGGWKINAISLRVEEQSRPNNSIYAWGPVGGGTIDMNWIPDDGWVDTALTWNTAGGFLDDPMELLVDEYPTVGQADANIFTDHFIDLPLASDFFADVMSGGMVSLYLTTQDPLEGFQFASANNNTDTRRPYLMLGVSAASAVPEPASLGLVAAGLLALARKRRRRL